MRTRLLFFLSLCVLSAPSFAQTLADSTESSSDNFERHVIKWPRLVWNGKSTHRILDYAAVTTKYKMVTNYRGSYRHYEEDKVRYNLSIVVNAAGSSTARVEAKVHEITRYTETSSILDMLVEATTGIDGSSTSYLLSQKTLSGTIATSLNAGAEWTFRLETEIDNVTSIRHRQGSIAHNDRVINIVDSRFPIHGAGSASVLRIEFVENDKRLGVIGEGAYLFSKDLDPELKLILAAAMEAVSFQRR